MSQILLLSFYLLGFLFERGREDVATFYPLCHNVIFFFFKASHKKKEHKRGTKWERETERKVKERNFYSRRMNGHSLLTKPPPAAMHVYSLLHLSISHKNHLPGKHAYTHTHTQRHTHTHTVAHTHIYTHTHIFDSVVRKKSS